VRRREIISMALLLGSASSTAVWSQARIYRVAFLALEPPDEPAYILRRLRELGYDYGRNLVFVQRSARGDPSRLEELAQELVREEPDVIVTGFGALAAASRKGRDDQDTDCFHGNWRTTCGGDHWRSRSPRKQRDWTDRPSGRT
jgi:hypothetical protein